MSSPAQPGSDGAPSPAPATPPAVAPATAAVDSGQREDFPAAAVPPVAPTIASSSDSPPAPAKQAGPEKVVARRAGRKSQQQKRKQNKAQSPVKRGLSSASSFSPAASPDPALSTRTQAVTPDIPTTAKSSPSSPPTAVGSPILETSMADDKKTEVVQDPAVAAGQIQEGAAIDAIDNLVDAGQLPVVKATVARASRPTSPPRKRGVITNSPSPKMKVFNALASLTPSPDKDIAKAESAKGLKSLLDRGAEPASSEHSTASSVLAHVAPSFEAKVMATVLLSMITLGFVILFLLPKKHTEPYCTTQCCIEHRNRISKQLDKEVNPCDDFTAHVCGRWLPHHAISLSRSVMMDMFLSWQSKFREILDNAFPHFTVAKKVAAMFNSCLRQNDSQIPVMKEFMREHGITWPEVPDSPIPPARPLFDLSLNWNVNLWFSLKILPAVPNEKPRRIFFKPNHLMVLWKAIYTQIPKVYLDRVYIDFFKLFSNKSDALPSPERMRETYGMLEFVFAVLVPSCPCKARIPALLSLNKTNTLNLPIGTDVVDTLNKVTGIHPPFTLEDLVLVHDAAKFKYAMELLIHFDNARVLRHLSWLFVQAYGWVAYPTAVLLLLHGSEQRANEERPLICAGHVEASYKLLVAAMASVGLFTEDERERLSDYMARIVQAAIDRTVASPWLDNKTSQVAVAKFRSVRTVLWPSEKFLKAETLEEVYESFSDSSPSFTQFWIDTRRSQRELYGSEAAEEELRLGDNTRLPYMDYSQVLSQLSVSLGALAPPLYCRDGSIGMIYGGLLYYYARSLIRAVDSEGVKIDPQGDIVGSWLSQDIQDAFDQRTLYCLPGNESIFPEIPAMEVAYAAFKQHLEENNTQLSEELTEEKVFFITACLATCSATPADNLFGGDCNKAVMNFAPFAQAFNCPVGTKMNPAKKCTFYE